MIEKAPHGTENGTTASIKTNNTQHCTDLFGQHAGREHTEKQLSLVIKKGGKSETDILNQRKKDCTEEVAAGVACVPSVRWRIRNWSLVLNVTEGTSKKR